MFQVDHRDLAEVLNLLEAWPAEGSLQASWDALPARCYPALFRLLDIAADLPRLRGNPTLESLPNGLWPELSQVAGHLVRLQGIVDRPIVPRSSQLSRCQSDHRTAAAELEETHCTTIDFLFDRDQQGALESIVARLAEERQGRWGQLEPDEAPELFELLGQSLDSHRFRKLTGFGPEAGELIVTLSLQDLENTGIGWHRDLYWPVEWVGREVFAAFLALGDDSPEKGGAFVYYLPQKSSTHHIYRRRGQATLLWNSADAEGRIFHAVSGYHTPDTSRHLLILQCLRHRDLRSPGDGG